METNPFTSIQEQLNEIKVQNQEILLAIGNRASNEDQTALLDTLPDRLRSRDIRKLFNISSVTVWQWEKKLILKPQVINTRKYYSKKDVLKLLNEKTTNKKGA